MSKSTIESAHLFNIFSSYNSKQQKPYSPTDTLHHILNCGKKFLLRHK